MDREEKILKKFKGDPYIVQYIDSFDDPENKLKIIVMDYCPITSLRNYI